MSDVCSVVQVTATNANGDVVHVLYTIRATLMQAGRGLPLSDGSVHESPCCIVDS